MNEYIPQKLYDTLIQLCLTPKYTFSIKESPRIICAATEITINSTISLSLVSATTFIGRCRQPFWQWPCNFQMRATFPSVKGWRQRHISVTINFHTTNPPDNIPIPCKLLLEVPPMQTQPTIKQRIPMTTWIDPRRKERFALYDVTISCWCTWGEEPAPTTPWGAAATRRSESSDILHGRFVPWDVIKYTAYMTIWIVWKYVAFMRIKWGIGWSFCSVTFFLFLPVIMLSVIRSEKKSHA